MSASAGLTSLAYQLPDNRISLQTLEREGVLTSDAAFLRDIGFENCYRYDGTAFDEVRLESARSALSGAAIDGTAVRWLFRYSGLDDDTTAGGFAAGVPVATGSAVPRPESNAETEVLERFRYPVARMQEQLGLTAAAAVSLGQQGCGGLLSALHMARRLATDGEAVLCVAGDALPVHSGREVIYNVMTDAAASVVIEVGARRNRIVHFHQQSMPYYWDTPLHTQELLASYFPLAQRVIEKTLDGAGLVADDIRWVVPHNVNLRSWRILSELIGIPEARVWTDNIARVGHTVSCDHIINLCDMESQGALEKGDRLLLFTFGFGANWSCMILEH